MVESARLRERRGQPGDARKMRATDWRIDSDESGGLGMGEEREPSDERMTTVFESAGLSAEMEAQAIHGLLESNGIESLVVRENVVELPVGKVEVRVMASDEERAREVIREGESAGPQAAEEAEAESEL